MKHVAFAAVNATEILYEPMASAYPWHAGQPPSIGWWPASTCGDARMIRWYDGQHWSCPAEPTDTAQEAAATAQIRSCNTQPILWTSRWWSSKGKGVAV